VRKKPWPAPDACSVQSPEAGTSAISGTMRVKPASEAAIASISPRRRDRDAHASVDALCTRGDARRIVRGRKLVLERVLDRCAEAVGRERRQRELDETAALGREHGLDAIRARPFRNRSVSLLQHATVEPEHCPRIRARGVRRVGQQHTQRRHAGSVTR
jgi:hypothetical protein